MSDVLEAMLKDMGGMLFFNGYFVNFGMKCFMQPSELAGLDGVTFIPFANPKADPIIKDLVAFAQRVCVTLPTEDRQSSTTAEAAKATQPNK